MKTAEEIYSEHLPKGTVHFPETKLAMLMAMHEYGAMLILANEEKWRGVLQELKNDLLMFKDKCNHQQKIGLDIAIEQADRYKKGKLC